MANSKLDRDLFDSLRARGLRKRVARVLAQAGTAAGGTLPKPARQAIADIRSLADDLEDRVKRGPAKRSEAAAKAARTRRRNAAKRSASASKAARTRTGGSRRA